jgi:tetratricopeptide (TPR) repeat protein
MKPGQQPTAVKPEPDLRPPGNRAETNAVHPGKRGLVWAALAAVILLGLAVLLVLPGMVSQSASPGPVSVSEPEPALAEETPRADGQGVEQSKRRAMQAMQDFLQARARLELANAPAWGEPEWSQAVDGADRGNDLFGELEFERAAETFQSSLEILIGLESGKDQRLADALESGWQALQANDSMAAVAFFETAVAIDADNEEALEGLGRARLRPQLLHLMAAGDSARSANELQQAQSAYAEAVGLDGLYEPAATALQQVSEEITDIAFRDAISRALNAMQAQDTQTAESALRQAASLKPDEQVVSDTRYQLAQLKQKIWLAGQRRAAAIAVGDEDWSDAVTIYRNVLKKVPQAAFATQGLELAEDRERTHAQLDHYLTDPARIYSAQPLANAKKLMASVAEPPPEEIRLAEKIQRLKALIVQAETPLPVTLLSDGVTNVLIYRVGRLGAFTSQQLDLTPGTYTVVGTRPGYRDVRHILVVKPGAEPPALDIRCEETV